MSDQDDTGASVWGERTEDVLRWIEEHCPVRLEPWQREVLLGLGRGWAPPELYRVRVWPASVRWSGPTRQCLAPRWHRGRRGHGRRRP